MSINKYLQTKFNSKIIIRISDDVAFFYKIEKYYIRLIDCCLAWNKKDGYHRIVKDYLRKYNYLESNIQTQSTYEAMIESFKVDYSLNEFENSNREFPKELFEHKIRFEIPVIPTKEELDNFYSKIILE